MNIKIVEDIRAAGEAEQRLDYLLLARKDMDNP
jgi:hypothetical protein